MNRQFQNMGFNPNAQSFNPNAQSFNPGAQSFQPQGGYQQQNYQQQNQGYQHQGYQGQNYNPRGGYRGGGRGGYNHRGGHQQGGYNPYHGQQQYQQPQHGYYGNQQQQVSPTQQQVQQQPQEPVQQEAPTVQQPVQQPEPKIQTPEKAPQPTPQPQDETDDWDDEPTPAPAKLATKKPDSTPKYEPKPSKTEKQEEKPTEDKKEDKPEQKLAKVTMKADALPTNIRKSEKEHLNVVFIGHVDAGKSTIGGQILKLTGRVDARTLEKFEREAKEKNRESWYLSWCLDQNQEERDKGKTVECGRAFFETDTKHFTILDAPGHKSFVANMITGASQADIAVLVISARRGEFESGFDLGGQTREHAMLVKTSGVKKLIVLVNKMDESTVQWSEDRYKEIHDKLSKYLKKVGYNLKKDVHWVPASGQTGINILESKPELHPYYKGPSLIKYLDSLPKFDRSSGDGQGVRLPIVDKYKDMGLMVFGKLEAGEIIRGQTYTLMPNKQMIKVVQILTDDIEVDQCTAGENVKLKIDGVEEDDISSGFVICDNNSLCHYSNTFDVKLKIVELNKPLMGPGFQSIVHIHTVTEEVTVKTLICKINPKNGEKEPFTKGKAKFLKDGDLGIVRFKTSLPICIETFQKFERMGRLSLRDEGKTIAMGTIVKVVE